MGLKNVISKLAKNKFKIANFQLNRNLKVE